MRNTLIQDNFEELMKLNKEDRELVMSYLETWTESNPPEYPDGNTLCSKIESQFETYLYMIGVDKDEIDMNSVSDRIWEHASYVETSVNYILDTWRGQWDNELFAELVEDYLVVSES
jgi:hypothetical protein